MSGCINGGEAKGPSMLDVEHAQAYSHAPVPGNAKRTFSVPFIAAMTIMALLSVSGFIMAAWSTSELYRVKDQLSAARAAGVYGSLQQAERRGKGVAMSVFSGSGYWSDGPDMPYTRSDHAVVSDGTYIYVLGGQTNRSGVPTVLNKVVRYDIYKQSMTELEDMPVPRFRHNAVVLSGKIYVFNGLSQLEENGKPMPTIPGLDVYDIATGKWAPTNSGAQLATPRVDACADVVGGRVVVAGGYDADYTYLGSLEALDAAAARWGVVAGAQLSVPRGDCSAVSTGDQLFIMGGVEAYLPSPGFECSVGDNWQQCFKFSAANEVYDARTGTVTRKSDMLHARGDFGATLTANGRILVAGGETQNRTSGVWRETAHVWTAEYSPAEDVWSAKAPLPQPRFRFGMARAGYAVVAFGGHPTCPEGECFKVGLDTTAIYSDAQLQDAYISL
mmetsp:Transcript_23317/g.59640  ORF Transcript_23317/g.59640 Transcript_23317/m.59640 type:complete len:445 (-) Transcript_23317:419-1753(-)|eukprot:CAMPEP_0202868238 /NCGR_PEP_ID=MMETSP1391-20130828/10549_1 /ASSEMBLY_ACC=CAM_ASM_000867 /TAXON_ID=1034604 /ORGANISM="Chlamydomonas leiostraca, Strain SAG 11-49" /LENGTH=444 /DNA_ID=CAMNT_0049548379 /DNA_START=129 /DNA_END=1463 /DNA_ORIENTATION=+